MGINDFDECHHWWRHVMVTCCCCADISSHELCENMGYVSGSGDEMLPTRCNLRGVCVIHYDDHGYQCFWWTSSLMTTCCDDVLLLFGSFITWTVWARGVLVWIRRWNVVHTMWSRVVVVFIMMIRFSMFLMNIIIDDDLLWWRAVGIWRFHHAQCVCLWCICLDPVMECCKHHAIPGDLW